MKKLNLALLFPVVVLLAACGGKQDDKARLEEALTKPAKASPTTNFKPRCVDLKCIQEERKKKEAANVEKDPSAQQ
ncbi:hypothetical protein ACPRNU_13945 [Chromobacterium vaccinii]|uniref:hypothetical protein n=1 Tax=Chromobacterium vaccinii TaxID=1108595 RepID=UPI003C749540